MFANLGDCFEIPYWKTKVDDLPIGEQFGEMVCFDIPNFKIMHGLIHE